jgi:cytohesin
LHQGANPNIQNIRDLTPLHLAALDDLSDIVYSLLYFGANPNVQDCDGDTPLHIACQNGSEYTIQILLENNVDTTIKNKEGYSYEDIIKLNDEDE